MPLDHFATTGYGVVPTTQQKFDGAVAVNSSVVMVPMNWDGVGVLDAADGTYTSSALGAGTSGVRKYSGGAAIGTVVYFAPHHAPGVGRYDVASGSFRSIPIADGAARFAAALASAAVLTSAAPVVGPAGSVLVLHAFHLLSFTSLSLVAQDLASGHR